MTPEIYYRAHGIDEHYKIWHKTERNMIILMHSDGGSIVCSEKTFPICCGAICFVGSDVYHYTMPEEPSEYIRSKIFISDGELRALLSLVSETGGLGELFSRDALVYAQISEKEYAEAEHLYEAVFENVGNDSIKPILLSAFLRLLTYIEKNRHENISQGRDFIDRAINYVNMHITDPLEIEDICSEVHVSKYHFCREFKKRTGQTVMDYVLATRLVLAKDMILKSDATIGEVSERCGFSSISYFCRIFKQETGKTPLAYRRSSRGA